MVYRMMLLMNHRAAKVAVVMKWGRPSNVETANKAAAHRMAFATITAGSSFRNELRMEADTEYVAILHMRLYVSLPSSDSRYFPSFCANSWPNAFRW